MPSGIVKETVPASAERVFNLLHDYDRRLEWDTLLREAFLEEPYSNAEKGAVTMCRGKWLVGGISLQTVYVSFKPGKVAAVRLVNKPLFFERFAASIRHRDLPDGRSEVIYHFSFAARPALLRPLLDPLMAALLRIETTKRLRSLSRFLADQPPD